MTFDLVRFTKALPDRAKPFAPMILDASDALVAPFLIFGLGDRETLWGTAQAYQKDTGDWSPRLWSMQHVHAFPHVRIVKRAADVNYAYVMPDDGLGWGRGLLQLDFVAEYDWLKANDWRDPKLSIPKGVAHLKTKFDFFSSTAPVTGITDGKVVTMPPGFAKHWALPTGTFPDPRPLLSNALELASVAGYNAAKENVLLAVAAGGLAAVDLCTTPSQPNTPGNYSTDVQARADTCYAAYDNA